ncbi:hypothetical protein F2Q68_00000094 [Brassica cretica]|uniref:Uncharacterized protein n=1 Tax=Brassica cretica TaxID=69181 RepID=A0A8S9JJX2_BRACR|nr:hypothetical protein F2Q68_00000094 [Brassica cretica]
MQRRTWRQGAGAAWVTRDSTGTVLLHSRRSSGGRMFVDAINNPKALPSFKFKVLEIRHLLRSFLEWRMLVEPYDANRGARLIATSAVLDLRYQSYVAKGHRKWCSNVFENDLGDRSR